MCCTRWCVGAGGTTGGSEDRAEQVAQRAEAAAPTAAAVASGLDDHDLLAVAGDLLATQAGAGAVGRVADDLLELARVQRDGAAAATGVDLDPGGVDVLGHDLTLLPAPEGTADLLAILQVTLHRCCLPASFVRISA